MTHELKCDYDQFEAIEAGLKKHEIRLNDRNFRLYDMLYLRQTMRGTRCEYTGKDLEARVIFINDQQQYGVPDGYVIMSIEVIR